MGIKDKSWEYEQALCRFLHKYTPSGCYELRFVYASAQDDDPSKNEEKLYTAWFRYFFGVQKSERVAVFLTYFLCAVFDVFLCAVFDVFFIFFFFCSELNSCSLETYIRENNVMEDTSSLYRRRRKSAAGSEGKKRVHSKDSGKRESEGSGSSSQKPLEKKRRGLAQRIYDLVVRRGGHEVIGVIFPSHEICTHLIE
jgi:hypothetical protein